MLVFFLCKPLAYSAIVRAFLTLYVVSVFLLDLLAAFQLSLD